MTVFSIDLIMSLLAAVRGEPANWKGLKLITALSMRVATVARVRIRPPSPLSVAVTSKESLSIVSTCLMPSRAIASDLEFSCNTPNALSNNPSASACRFWCLSSGWSGGTRARDISFVSGRWWDISHCPPTNSFQHSPLGLISRLVSASAPHVPQI